MELLQRLGMKFGADILREKRTRDSIQSRVSDARMAFAFATTFFPKGLPSGRAEVIWTAPRERFLDFWNTGYRPARMAVVVEGDIAVALVEKLIAAQFSDLAARSPARPDPALGEIVKPTACAPIFIPKPRCPTPASRFFR